MAIYALLDYATLKKYNVTIEAFCKTAKGLKAKILQYRDKNSSTRQMRENLKLIRKHWTKPLIINDNPALLPYCDGLHIGIEDLQYLTTKYSLNEYEIISSIKEGRWFVENNEFYFAKKKINPCKMVGLSTHNKEEILKANAYPLDYIGLGAYRPTDTKQTDNILGEKIIDLIKFSYHPVAVIGGVKIYDKIPSNYKVVGSDICRLISIQSKKKRILKRKSKSL